MRKERAKRLTPICRLSLELGDSCGCTNSGANYSSAAPSRVTHVAQCVVFGAVMADAAMLDAALEMDVWGRVQDEDGRRV